MKLIIYNKLNKNLENEIHDFLLTNFSKFNPLFLSPLWAERLKSLLDFKYRYFIIRENGKILALHLIFDGYRGYAKINKLPIFLKSFGKLYAKVFYSYIAWQNFILFKNDLQKEKIVEIKELIYKSLQNRYILKSPIYERDEIYFNNKIISKWGTYILDISDKSYEEIYMKFRRQARKAIEKTKEKGVFVKLLDISKIEELEEYISWLKNNQKYTGKTYKINAKIIKNEFKFFKKNNYIYEVFIAIKDDKILGSLGVWGFGDFISEFGVYQSLYAKKNKLYVQDVIKEEIIKFMIKNNIKYYDLSGFNPAENATLKEKAIKQFKEKFRGKEIIYYMVEG